jgi:haloacetate dehalogenase
MTESGITGRLHAISEGSGPPLVLLHGFPETHRCWDRVASNLAGDFTIVRADLRGYGSSPKPSGEGAYAKREMAEDVRALMRELGYERFAIAGHDRGGLVAQRLAVDHPEAVTHLAVLGVIPALEMWESMTADFALAGFQLFFPRPTGSASRAAANRGARVCARLLPQLLVRQSGRNRS